MTIHHTDGKPTHVVSIGKDSAGEQGTMEIFEARAERKFGEVTFVATAPAGTITLTLSAAAFHEFVEFAQSIDVRGVGFRR